MGLREPGGGLPDPRRARVAGADPKGFVQRIAVARLGAGLPPEEPDLAEPGDQVSATSALLGPVQGLLLQKPERLQQELSASGLKGLEHRLLKASQGRLLREGHSDGYSQLGHVGVLSCGNERTLRALFHQVGISLRDWLAGDANWAPKRSHSRS